MATEIFSAFDTLATRLEALNFGLTQVRDLVQSIGTKGEELEHGWREQQGEHWKRLDAERERWEKAVREMEQEMGRLSEAYTKACQSCAVRHINIV